MASPLGPVASERTLLSVITSLVRVKAPSVCRLPENALLYPAPLVIVMALPEAVVFVNDAVASGTARCEEAKTRRESPANGWVGFRRIAAHAPESFTKVAGRLTGAAAHGPV